MGVFSGLERRLAGAVDKTFARIFGGAVQPAEVSAALYREAATHLTRHDSRVIAPNRYRVELGPSDSAQVNGDISRVNTAFSALLANHVHAQGWDTFADVAVTFEQSDRLHTGQFRVSSLVDPSVSSPHHTPSYDAALGHAPSAQHQTPAPPPYAAPRPDEPSYLPLSPQPGGYQPHHQPADHHQPYPAAQPYGYPPTSPPPPRLVVQDGTGRAHALTRGSNIIGRGADAALRLADQAVSRHHVDVYFDGRVAIAHDLGSTNGTVINGAPVQTWQLADGDVITIGRSTVVFAGR